MEQSTDFSSDESLCNPATLLPDGVTEDLGSTTGLQDESPPHLACSASQPPSEVLPVSQEIQGCWNHASDLSDQLASVAIQERSQDKKPARTAQVPTPLRRSERLRKSDRIAL